MALEDAAGQVDLAFTREDPKGLAYENAFAGATSFLRRRYAKDVTGADLAILGVPFDQAVTHRPGTRFGPRAIREASSLQPFDPPTGWDGFDPLSEFAIVDAGDVAFDYADVPSFPARLEAEAGRILDAGARLVSLGGDHSVTLPLLRAHAARSGPVAVIQFDAHSDLWPDPRRDRIDHGTFMGKAVEDGIVDVARSCQIGIRTVCEDMMGMPFVTAREVHELGLGWVTEKVRGLAGDGPVYVTFDIDALDPAFAPGTGTPVWGGLASWQAAALLRDLAGLNILGGDVVEVSPPYDTSAITAVAGAHVAMELCCLSLWTKRKK